MQGETQCEEEEEGGGGTVSLGVTATATSQLDVALFLLPLAAKEFARLRLMDGKWARGIQ